MKVLVPHALLLLSACSGPQPRITFTPPPERFVGIAVTPVNLGTDADDFEGVKRTADVIDTLWRHSDWYIVGPDDFRILKPQSEDYMFATDLVVQSQRLDINPERLSLLKTTVGVRQSSGHSVVSSAKGAGVGRDFKSEITVSATLQDIKGTLIIDAYHIVAVDPFAERPDYDPRPAVKQAVQHVIRAMIEKCQTCFQPAWRPEFSVGVSPGVLIAATDKDGRTLAQRVEAAGILEKDQLLWSNLQYLSPAIELRDARRHLKTPSGLCVGPEPPAPFKPGDCIVSVDGRPAQGPYALGQAARHGRTIELLVLDSDGTSRTVRFEPSSAN